MGGVGKAECRMMGLSCDAEALVLAETLVKDAELRAEEEKQRAEEAEAENAQLRKELARLRGEQQ